MNITESIRAELFESAEGEYAAFQAKLVPTIDKKTLIGVRVPILRKMAKKLEKNEQISEFLEDLPHEYYEENALHAYIVSDIRDIDRLIRALDAFLPYVDNWAICDGMSPTLFSKPEHSARVLDAAKGYIGSGKVYTMRFGLGVLMKYFLDDRFTPSILETAADACSDEYYVNMMVAWLFATALAKQYDTAVGYIEKRRLPVWVHNKTISKGVESYRIDDETKAYLRGMRIKE